MTVCFRITGDFDADREVDASVFTAAWLAEVGGLPLSGPDGTVGEMDAVQFLLGLTRALDDLGDPPADACGYRVVCALIGLARRAIEGGATISWS